MGHMAVGGGLVLQSSSLLIVCRLETMTTRLFNLKCIVFVLISMFHRPVLHTGDVGQVMSNMASTIACKKSVNKEKMLIFMRGLTHWLAPMSP